MNKYRWTHAVLFAWIGGTCAAWAQAETPPAPPPILKIGAEGYGPHVLEALESKDPQAVARALGWVERCAVAESTLDQIQKLRAERADMNPAVAAEAINRVQADQRRCQTLTPELVARVRELAFVAMQAGQRGAAYPYVEAMKFAPPDAEKPQLLRSLNLDARAGDLRAMSVLARHGRDWGLDARDAEVYALATELLMQEPNALIHAKSLDGSPVTLPSLQPSSPAQMEAARALAEAVRAGNHVSFRY